MVSTVLILSSISDIPQTRLFASIGGEGEYFCPTKIVCEGGKDMALVPHLVPNWVFHEQILQHVQYTRSSPGQNGGA